jgi:hypothetical protein
MSSLEISEMFFGQKFFGVKAIDVAGSSFHAVLACENHYFYMDA